MKRKFEDIIDVSDWEVLTDSGFKKISKVCKTVKYDVYHIETENFTLNCADTHILFDKDKKEIYVKDLSINDEIYTENGLEKVIKIEKKDQQENMFDLQVKSKDHAYYTNGILSHNTTCTTIYLLWYVLFHSDKNVALLANKGAMAREIMARIQLAYMYLPKWLQQGVLEWNKGSFKLENGSKMLAAATSSDSVRGSSFSCVFIDECLDGNSYVTIKDKETGQVQNISLKDLYKTLK